jgi:hypothetical protein
MTIQHIEQVHHHCLVSPSIVTSLFALLGSHPAGLCRLDTLLPIAADHWYDNRE